MKSPKFQGIGPARALLEAPKGGHDIVTGIGLFTGGINDRAVAALWKAGAIRSWMTCASSVAHGPTPLMARA